MSSSNHVPSAKGRRAGRRGSVRPWLETLEQRVLLNLDFGDAPDPLPGTGPGNYNTLAGDNGPSHVMVPGLFLGATVDMEADAAPNDQANGDDLTGPEPDDEDGLVSPQADLNLAIGVAPSVDIRVTNLSGSAARLFGWIDYNADGIFDNDTTERAQIDVPNGSDGMVLTLNFPTVPGGFAGITYARFRLSNDPMASNSTGPAMDGEVEDYLARISLDPPPTVTIDQAASQPDPSNASPLLFTAVFSEPVAGFTGSDVSLAGSTVGGTLTAQVSESGPMDGTTYTVSVSGMMGTGTVVASIPANAVMDDSMNGNLASTSMDNRVFFDGVPPTVTIDQAAGQPDPSNASTVLFTAVFSEPVTGFTGSDVSLAGSTVGGTLTAQVSESGPMDGTTYTVSVSGMMGTGTVVASIPANAAMDAVGNSNLASTSMDNAVFFDGVPPTVTIDQAAGQPDPTNGPAVRFTAVFSEPVTGFSADDVSLAGSTSASTLSVQVGESGPNDGTTYTITVMVMGSGTVVASIPANAAMDAASNGNLASTSMDNSVTFDRIPPQVTLEQAATQADPTDASPVLFTAVFSEPVTGFAGSDVSLAGSTVGGTLTARVSQSGPLDGTTYTVRVSGMMGTGTVVASVLAGAATDVAGNPSLPFTGSPGRDNVITFLSTPPTPVTGDITGLLFLDGNANRRPDADEVGFPDRPIVLNPSGMAGAETTRTDGQGQFTFAAVAEGTYQVLANLPGGSFTFTASDGITVNLGGSSPGASDVHLGVHTVTPAINPTFPDPDLFVATIPGASTNILYVQALYRSILGREAEPAGVGNWVGMLPDPAMVTPTVYALARLNVTKGIWESYEHRGLQINQYYLDLLGRLPDAQGGRFWFDQLFYGAMSEEEVIAGLLTSPEYQDQFSSDQAFVRGLFNDVLGAPRNTTFVLSYNAAPFNVLERLQSGARTREQTVVDVLFSDQTILRGLAGCYQGFLHRQEATLPEQEFWLSFSRTTGRLRDVAIGVLGSETYRDLLQP